MSSSELKIETYKTIGDVVHGSIPVSKVESDILQLPVLNRLHHVKQMSMAYYVFPGAQISRFAHSIGALYVGGLIATKLMGTTDQTEHEKIFGTAKPIDVLQTIRIACMLHDVGHGPFSHDSEDLMRKCLTQDHSSEVEEAAKLFPEKSIDKLPVHEFYSYKLITQSEISEIIRKNGLIPEAVGSLLTKQDSVEFWPQQGFQIIKKIVSSQLDADRLDYLLRDGLATGVPYGTVDIQRLISNLIIFTKKNGQKILAIHERAQSTIEHILNARFMMYKWIYTHHMVVACEELMKKAIEKLIDLHKLNLEDLYWMKFKDGLSDDTLIWQTLLTAFELAPKELIAFKGLLDRRFLPNSILKRPLDYAALVADVEKLSEVGAERITKQRVKSFFTEPKEQEKFRLRLESKGEPLSKIVLMATHKPRSPYEPLSPEDRVMIYHQRTRKVEELTEVSSYFDSINSEWTSFPDVYLSYLIPGVTKSDSSNYLAVVRSELVSFIASDAS